MKDKLTEHNLDAGAKVLWKNQEYLTGNRRHDLVDLYRHGDFIRTVRMQSVSLLKEGVMKEIKILPVIDLVNDKDALEKLEQFKKTYKPQYWNNKIALPKSLNTFEAGVDYAHILLINFWESFCRNSGNGFYVHPDFSMPSFKIEKNKDTLTIEWTQTLFKKRNDAD